MSHSDIHLVSRANPQANVDGSLSTYTDGNTRYWVAPNVEWTCQAGTVTCPRTGQSVPDCDFVVWHTTTTSTLQAGLGDPEGTSRQKLPQWDFFTDPAPTEGGRWWLVSTYKINEGEALGFVHVEFADYTPGATSCGSGYFGRGRIGVAYFKHGQNNNKWRYMGHVLTPKLDPPNINILGAPYVIRTEADQRTYVYLYYGDAGGYAVAKTDLPNLIAAAQQGLDSPPWYKWGGGSWNNPGHGGAFQPLSFGVFPQTILHAGAGFSTYANKYFLAATRQTHNPPTAILLFESCDGLTWTERAALEETVDPSLRIGWQYTTVLDTDPIAWPRGTFHDSFYVYAGWEYDRNVPTDPYDAIWRRLKVTLAAGDVGCAAAPDGGPLDAGFDGGAGVDGGLDGGDGGAGIDGGLDGGPDGGAGVDGGVDPGADGGSVAVVDGGDLDKAATQSCGCAADLADPWGCLAVLGLFLGRLRAHSNAIERKQKHCLEATLHAAVVVERAHQG